LYGRAVVDKVRTGWYSNDPELMEILDNIREIKRELPPDALLPPVSVRGGE